MKWIKAMLTLGLSFLLLFVLNTKWGDVPPAGKFFSPFTGFWQNAEARDGGKGDQKLVLPGLKGPVTIAFDHNRVPHLFADTDYDLYFTQGYVTARDRLWQMEFQTHAAAGRISELVGNKALGLDRFQRRMGMVYGAQQSLAGMMADPQTREMLEAYSAGINAYIQSLSPKDYPIEYKLLDYAPETWSPLKCSLLLKMMAADLAGRSDDLRLSNILNKYGPEVVRDLFPDYPFREDPIVPVGTKLDFQPLPVPEAPGGFPARTSGNILEREPPAELGSNNWAVAGSRTLTGFPMLANDPHLQLNLPSIWYQIQLAGPGVNVAGVSLPGAPGVIIGFNKDISWGVTNVDADVMDWYEVKFKDDQKKQYWHGGQWKPVRRVIEHILVRSGETVADTVYYTHHGPVVYDKAEKVFNAQVPVHHALRWIAHEKSNELRTFYLLNRAANYHDYLQALSYYVAPAQNFVYADVHQDIALWPNGRFPLKWKGQGKFILDGTDPASDWNAWIPQGHNPHVKNPARGFVSSANQSSAGPDYPYYINWQFASPERGIRINQRLARMTRVTPDSLRTLQNDNFNIHAETILPVLLRQVKTGALNQEQQRAYRILQNWRYYHDPRQVGPTIFDLWWTTLNQAIWEDDLGSSPALPMRLPSKDRTIRMLQKEPGARWFDDKRTPEKETMASLVHQSFVATLDSLTRQHGPLGETWEWSRHKATSIQHLAKLQGFGRENLEIGGGRGIVNATSERHGPSWRMVVALGPQVKGYGVYPGGQSGNPGSYYYDNMVDTWRQGKLHELVYLTHKTQKSNQLQATWQLQPK